MSNYRYEGEGLRVLYIEHVRELILHIIELIQVNEAFEQNDSKARTFDTCARSPFDASFDDVSQSLKPGATVGGATI